MTHIILFPMDARERGAQGIIVYLFHYLFIGFVIYNDVFE